MWPMVNSPAPKSEASSGLVNDRYDELYRSWRWEVPECFNIARACCGRWAADRSRFALYWEDESGATSAHKPRAAE